MAAITTAAIIAAAKKVVEIIGIPLAAVAGRAAVDELEQKRREREAKRAKEKLK